MGRSYDEPVHVREPGATPTAFVWRGRHYVVREVVAHWYERRAWWTEDAARAVHGDAGPGQRGGRQGTPDPGADREVWRVEASAGRQLGTGVYDLCRGADGRGADGRGADGDGPWRLLRVAD